MQLLINNFYLSLCTDVNEDVLENSNFRKVLYTGQHMQLVLTTLTPGEEIGEETHFKSDQFFRFESGTGRCIVNGTEYEIKAGDVVLVPSGSKHNVINTGAIDWSQNGSSSYAL